MRRFFALTSVFLASLTSGCAGNSPVVTTEYRYLALPDVYLQDCPKAEWGGGTYRQMGELAAARGTDVDNCNAQLKRGREYQAEQIRKYNPVVDKKQP